MAQLKDTVVQGSLRVTDTTYTTNENISSLTASQAVITDSNKNLISRDIYNKTAVGDLGWTAVGTDIHLVTKNVLAYWNGRYNGSTSNLAYCNKGAFGDMAIKTKGNGFSDSSNTISVAYGTAVNTAVQGNQTIFTLNGGAKNSGSSASFYAPTGGGTVGYLLKAGGNNIAPEWIQYVPVANGGTGISTTDPHKVLIGPASGTSAAAPTWRTILNNEIEPIKSKTYTNVTVTEDKDPTGWLYFFKAGRLSTATYNDIWRLTYKVTAYCAGQVDSKQVSIVHIDGVRNTYVSYYTWNSVGNTSYRPFYAHIGYWASNNASAPDYAPICGLRFQSSYAPTNSTYARTIIFDILEQENCDVTFFDSGLLYTNVSGTGSTYFGGRFSFDGTTQGMTMSGDRNTTSISNLYNQYGGDVAATFIGRYHLIFEDINHKLVSFQTVDASTDALRDKIDKSLNTSVEFNPCGRIYYYNSTGTNAINTNIDPGRLYYTYLVDLRFAFNVKSSAATGTFTGTRYLPLYLKTQMNTNNGLVHVTDNQPFVTELPSTQDNYYYIYLGQIHDWYRVMLERNHPVYYHNGSGIEIYHGHNTLSTINGNVQLQPINIYAPTTVGTSGYLLQSNGTGAPSWIQATDSNVASTIVKRNSSGNFSANIISSTLNGLIAYQSTLTKGQAPTGDVLRFTYCSTYESGTGREAANRIGGLVEGLIDTNGRAGLVLRAYQHTANSDVNNNLVLYCAQDGTATYSVSNPANFCKAIGAPQIKVVKFTSKTINSTGYTYTDSWITADTAVVATDLQLQSLVGIVEWTITAGSIKFTCATSTTLTFSIMMLKPCT